MHCTPFKYISYFHTFHIIFSCQRFGGKQKLSNRLNNSHVIISLFSKHSVTMWQCSHPTLSYQLIVYFNNLRAQAFDLHSTRVHMTPSESSGIIQLPMAFRSTDWCSNQFSILLPLLGCHLWIVSSEHSSGEHTVCKRVLRYSEWYTTIPLSLEWH